MQPTAEFRVLAAAALADGVLETQERRSLLQHAERLGLTPEDAQATLQELSRSGRLDATPPADPDARRRLFERLLDVVVVDDDLAEGELRLLERLREAFGYDAATLRGLLEQAAVRGRYARRAPPSAEEVARLPVIPHPNALGPGLLLFVALALPVALFAGWALLTGAGTPTPDELFAQAQRPGGKGPSAAAFAWGVGYLVWVGVAFWVFLRWQRRGWARLLRGEAVATVTRLTACGPQPPVQPVLFGALGWYGGYRQG